MSEPLAAAVTRRYFFGQQTLSLGAAALAALLPTPADAVDDQPAPLPHGIPRTGLPRAKRIIYIMQAGGPAQMELYDHKPLLRRLHGQELPASVRAGQRLTGFTAGQGSYPIVASSFRFRQRGASGLWLSELLPHLGSVADELCMIHSLHTEAVNHDPAVTYLLTGSQQAGRPSLGAWLSYGLGSENDNLPAFVVLLTPGQIQDASTPLSARHWGSGFLPSRHQGVKFRPGQDPVLFLSNPPGVDQTARRQMLDVASQLNQRHYEAAGDPETQTRIAQFELAFRMQTSVPHLTDVSGEPAHVFDMYGPQSRTPGTYAANCLLARRLVEAGVRFVQIFDRDWDHHRNAPQHLRTKSQTSDQPTAALIRDLKQRGLLDETLIVCGGEFGRTVYAQGALQEKYGRDHHGGCFTVWLAGGGIRRGYRLGETDEFCFNITQSPVHIHDLQATLLHCLGIDHRRLTFKFQSRQQRLTDTGGRVIREILV